MKELNYNLEEMDFINEKTAYIKVDNQLNRIWYCYLLAKDSAGNIIPSNTLPIIFFLSLLSISP